MGILDKLIKEGSELIKEATSEENKEKANELFGQLKNVISEKAEELSKVLEEQKAESSTSNTSSLYEEVDDGLDVRERILKILKEDFPEYEVRENVSPTTIGGTGRFMDYSLGVYQNGEAKLFIMLIGKTTTSHREYRWSKEEAEKNNIAFINFIRHYPNNPEYIRKRLQQYL